MGHIISKSDHFLHVLLAEADGQLKDGREVSAHDLVLSEDFSVARSNNLVKTAVMTISASHVGWSGSVCRFTVVVWEDRTNQRVLESASTLAVNILLVHSTRRGIGLTRRILRRAAECPHPNHIRVSFLRA